MTGPSKPGGVSSSFDIVAVGTVETQNPPTPEPSEQIAGSFEQLGKGISQAILGTPEFLGVKGSNDTPGKTQSTILEESPGFAGLEGVEKRTLQIDSSVKLGEEMEKVAVVSGETRRHSQSLGLREQTNCEPYLDPTPRTPRLSSSPARAVVGSSEALDENGIAPEIENIMGQFVDGNAGAQESSDSDHTPEGEIHLRLPLKHPPRRSSLEPLHETSCAGKNEPGIICRPPDKDLISRPATTTSEPHSDPVSPSSRLSDQIKCANEGMSGIDIPPSPHSSVSLPKKMPPSPDPEPDLPFDFHRFLEQLRHRTADPVARYLRSFLSEFGKKQWMAHEQVKFIGDFLTFIANKMAYCEIWRHITEAEFDNVKEGMEKLVMNRLYSQTFSPAIPSLSPDVGGRGKRKGEEKVLRTGRRGQHQEDVERDDVLSQKIRIYGWVREEHLDIAAVGGNGKRLLDLAQQELLKIKTYRAPRDKIICVLNCCKVIFGLLRNAKTSDTSADAFVPLLIYVVLHANPEHLVSNVQYILRFRNQDKLGGEAGYYLSSLMGAIQFIENLDRTSLTVTDQEFEENVEAAVSAITERHQSPSSPNRSVGQPSYVRVSEKSEISQPEVARRTPTELERSPLRRAISGRGKPSGTLDQQKPEEDTAVNGLLRTIQRPLSSLGKMFIDESDNVSNTLVETPRRLSPAVFQPPRRSDEIDVSRDRLLSTIRSSENPSKKMKAEDAAARQASAEAAEAQRIQRAEHVNVIETLAGMFPNLEKDVIDDVVKMKQGRVGLAVDACLALNS